MKNTALDVYKKGLSKGGEGEGSRGGKIIGHTQSGKPIYSSAATFRGNEGYYGDVTRVLSADTESHVAGKTTHYTRQDHEDAADHHEKAAAAIRPPAAMYDAGGKGTQQYRHQRVAEAHRAIASKMKQGKAPEHHVAVNLPKAPKNDLKNSMTGHKSQETHMRKSETAVDVYKQHLEPATVCKSQQSTALDRTESEPTDAVGVYKSFLAKAGNSGEGSRGGRIMGHTKSGAPIYESSSSVNKPIKAASAEASNSHEGFSPKNRQNIGEVTQGQHPEYSKQDHLDASAAHDKKKDGAKSDAQRHEHSKISNAHYEAARNLGHREPGEK